MSLRRVGAVLAVAIGCVLTACAKPPPLTPAASSLAVNDGRSIEHCTALGTVSATLANVPIDHPVDMYLRPQLLNKAADRGANYLEATPAQCSRYTPCAETGTAYRCPGEGAAADAKAI